MVEEKFIDKNMTKWQTLEDYNQKLQNKSLTILSKAEIREFTELFRLAGHHLAYARTHFKESKTSQYLNQLVGASHNHFYTTEKSSLGDITDYFLSEFPIKVRNEKKYVYLAFMAFLAGAVFTSIIILLNSQYLYFFLPEEQLNAIDFSSTAREIDYPVFSAFIMTNNIKVCFLSFVWGFFAGIGTLYVLFTNGMLIGALTTFVVTSNANIMNYWALILPHGFIELTAIFISGAAGLMLGKSILIPNNMSRKHSMIKGAKEAAKLIPGVMIMLVIAGIIEGFFTPLNIPPILKLLFAFLTLIGLVIYFRFSGKKSSHENKISLR